ncbi:MAG: hypothetical protein ABIP58_06460 [Dehalococcoidia bacterium]
MYYDSSHSESRLGLSSVILLTIFISAFALIVVAALWRPWAEDDGAPEGVLPGITIDEAPAEDESQAEVEAAPAAP